MPAITEYSTREAFLRLLLQGPPGSGKTTLACGFPGAHIIDIDVNLGGPLRYRKNHGMTLPVSYDRLDVDEEGKLVPGPLRWDRLDACLIKAQTDPAVQTIIIDSATGLADLRFQETCRQNPSVKDGRQQYGLFLGDGKKLIATLTAMKKNIVLTAHEKIEQDSMTQIMQYRVMWPGQLGDYLGAFFTNVWRCEVEAVGYPPKPKFIVRTFQDAQHYGLKNDLELPTIYEFNWNEIAKKLEVS